MDEKPERSLSEIAADLSQRVDALGRRLKVSQRQVVRMRYLTVITGLLAVASTIGAIYSYQISQRVEDTATANQENAVIACRNANELREANLNLWTFVLQASAADPEQTPAEKRLAEEFRDWINVLYAPRDCSDLSRHYDLPPPPSLGP